MRQRSAPGIVKRSVLGRVAAQQIVGEGLLLHRLRLLRKSPSTQALCPLFAASIGKKRIHNRKPLSAMHGTHGVMGIR